MNLLYLSYGTGPHEQEVIFSVLSALHWTPEGGNYRVLIYTDHPDIFTDLPAQVQFISPIQWSDWAGPQNFNHRRKILALKHAFEHYDGAVILLDGDTWLRAPASILFDRVSPGHSLMHIQEGRVSEIDTPQSRKLRDLLKDAGLRDDKGENLRISPDIEMYNAGVVGLDPADAGLLDEVLALTDQLSAKSDLHVLEQLAFSYVLGQQTNLSEADDLVFHYWPPYLHVPFRKALPKLMADSASKPVGGRARYLFAHRPRPTLLRRCKVIVKRVLQFSGVIRGRCRTNEW